MKIEWKEHKIFTDYIVSNTGRVRRKQIFVKFSNGTVQLKEEKEIKQNISNKYFYVNIFKDGISNHVSVHRLVADCFLENTHNKETVNHIDEDKLNNLSTNLEWCTYKENCNHGTRNKKISEKQLGNLNHYYKFINHFETVATRKDCFKAHCKNKGLDINDFEETFSHKAYIGKVKRNYFFYKLKRSDEIENKQ